MNESRVVEEIKKENEEKEKTEIKQMLESSKRIYQKEIRAMENKISWYERQLEILDNSLYYKLSVNKSLLIPKEVKK